MIIDCDRCEVRGDACADCVVTVLLGPPKELELDVPERRALDVLAAGGMVPRLRLVQCDQNHYKDGCGGASQVRGGSRAERSAPDAERSQRHVI